MTTTENPIRRIAKNIKNLKYTGNARYCPICSKSSSKFRSQGYVSVRLDAGCPRCGSLERHRLFWRFLTSKTDLFSPGDKKVLHVGAEAVFTAKLAAVLGAGYLTADLYNPSAMVKMDITAIEFPDNHFDVILCSHVLEHVPDDRLAMQELLRVLKPAGWAILLVPISQSTNTFEDFSIVNPADRLVAFGQEDHVRIYGQDFIDRVRGAGFLVDKYAPADFNSTEDVERMSLGPAAGDVFFCTKP